MLLNIGSGDRYAQGWHNVDHEGSPHPVDATVDITRKLPWAPDSILHVYMGHVLEHITYSQARAFLKRLRPLVQKHGQILIVGPDVDVARQLESRGELDVTLDSLVNGGDRWPGDVHRWECTAEKIEALLQDTGWTDIQRVPIAETALFWPVADRGPTWQCAVTARS